MRMLLCVLTCCICSAGGALQAAVINFSDVFKDTSTANVSYWTGTYDPAAFGGSSATVYSVVANFGPGWANPGPGTWINQDPNGNGANSGLPGFFTYTQKFNPGNQVGTLTGNPIVATDPLSFQVAGDDILAVYVNNVLVASGLSWTPLVTISPTLLNNQENIITLKVQNLSGWTGAIVTNVQGSFESVLPEPPPVPEPISMIGFGSLMGLAFLSRFRRKS